MIHPASREPKRPRPAKTIAVKNNGKSIKNSGLFPMVVQHQTRETENFGMVLVGLLAKNQKRHLPGSRNRTIICCVVKWVKLIC